MKINTDSAIVIKILLSIVLLVCLLKMPYGYYQFVRIAACFGFAFLAFKEFQKENVLLGMLCVGVAILFNPILKIYFKRSVWQTIDLSFAIVLFIWAILSYYSVAKKGKSRTLKHF